MQGARRPELLKAMPNQMASGPKAQKTIWFREHTKHIVKAHVREYQSSPTSLRFPIPEVRK